VKTIKKGPSLSKENTQPEQPEHCSLKKMKEERQASQQADPEKEKKKKKKKKREMMPRSRGRLAYNQLASRATGRHSAKAVRERERDCQTGRSLTRTVKFIGSIGIVNIKNLKRERKKERMRGARETKRERNERAERRTSRTARQGRVTDSKNNAQRAGKLISRRVLAGR
jgi:hypothetical protein